MSTVTTNNRTQALGRLYRSLQKGGVPDISFDVEGPDPVVYTEGTFTRVREGKFLIRRVSIYGLTLETVTIPVGHVPVAALMIHAMTQTALASKGA